MEQYNRDLAAWERQVREKQKPAQKSRQAAPAGERAEAPAPASGGGQKEKAKSPKPTTGTIAFTSKTTPQASCGAYIKNAPRGFLPERMLYMDLFAIFSLAAVNGCKGQGQCPLQAVPCQKAILLSSLICGDWVSSVTAAALTVNSVVAVLGWKQSPACACRQTEFPDIQFSN